MCDFKPGDEVVCIKDFSGYAVKHPAAIGTVVTGHAYTVSMVVAATYPDGQPSGRIGITLVETGFKTTDGRLGLYNPSRFRKVQKRNDRLTIEAFSTIKDGGFEEPRRAPAKKRERVQ